MNLKKMLLPSLFVFSSAAMAVTDNDFNNLKKIVGIQQAEIALLKKAPYVCRGKGRLETSWENYNGNEKFAHATINTSSCKFKTTPTYFVSGRTVVDSGTWELGGYTGIYSPTSTSFQVYVWNGYNRETAAFPLVTSTGYYFDWIGVE